MQSVQRVTDPILSQWGLIFVPTTSELLQFNSLCVHDRRVVMLGDGHRLLTNNQQLQVKGGRENADLTAQ